MKKIVVVYGPTTSNKLGLALNLSKYVWGKYRIETEVINTDSRKIYRGFIVSQSLPDKSFSEKVKLHLFAEVLPEKRLEVFEFQKLVRSRIADIQQRGNLPILVGGSSLHLRSIILDWKEGEENQQKNCPENVLIFGIIINKPALKKAVILNVSRMFTNGLYEEFKKLYVMSEQGRVSIVLLKETLGYRQFLEMAEVSQKSPLNLKDSDLSKIKKWLVKDILDFAYHQTLDYKKFPGIHLVTDFSEARKIIDSFIDQNEK